MLNGFDSFDQETYNPQGGDKKTETLDSVLVAKNSYRVRMPMPSSSTGRDEGMSFDVAGQRLFGSNIAIKDGLLYGSSLGDLTIEAYFQGRRPTFRGHPPLSPLENKIVSSLINGVGHRSE